MNSETRKEKRQQVNIRAKAAMGPGAPQHDCVILDISATGARLTMDPAAEVSEEFMIVFTARGRPYRLCRVVWRRNGQIGVAFDKKRSSNSYNEDETNAPGK